MSRADFCRQGQMKNGLLAFGGERFTFPARVGRFTMDRMILAAIAHLITTERQTEKIAAQGFDDGRLRRVDLLFGPGGYGERLDLPAAAPKSDRTKMTSELRHKRRYLVIG